MDWTSIWIASTLSCLVFVTHSFLSVCWLIDICLLKIFCASQWLDHWISASSVFLANCHSEIILNFVKSFEIALMCEIGWVEPLFEIGSCETRLLTSCNDIGWFFSPRAWDLFVWHWVFSISLKSPFPNAHDPIFCYHFDRNPPINGLV